MVKDCISMSYSWSGCTRELLNLFVILDNKTSPNFRGLGEEREVNVTLGYEEPVVQNL